MTADQNQNQMDHKEVINLLENWANWDVQQFGMIIRRQDMPELIGVAPCVGERYQVGRFIVQRAKVDQLDQFTIIPPRIEPPRCSVCNGRLDEDGSCWWCANPE
jgi:hypothetical protein